jgi:hypothetical protein
MRLMVIHIQENKASLWWLSLWVCTPPSFESWTRHVRSRCFFYKTKPPRASPGGLIFCYPRSRSHCGRGRSCIATSSVRLGYRVNIILLCVYWLVSIVPYHKISMLICPMQYMLSSLRLLIHYQS